MNYILQSILFQSSVSHDVILICGFAKETFLININEMLFCGNHNTFVFCSGFFEE